MNDTLLAVVLLLASAPTHADEAFIGYGVGVFHSADDYTGQMKVAEVGYRHFLFDGVYWQNKIGYWGEGSNDKTRHSSGYGFTSFGVEMDLQPLELRSGYGIGGITDTDSQLGGHLQFNGEVYAGLRDKRGDGIGVKYNHVSCASLCSPNHGRDFMTIELSMKW